jgi:hypothetical protein
MINTQIDCLGKQFTLTHTYISRKEGDIITYNHEQKCNCEFMKQARDLALQILKRA